MPSPICDAGCGSYQLDSPLLTLGEWEITLNSLILTNLSTQTEKIINRTGVGGNLAIPAQIGLDLCEFELGNIAIIDIAQPQALSFAPCDPTGWPTRRIFYFSVIFADSNGVIGCTGFARIFDPRVVYSKPTWRLINNTGTVDVSDSLKRDCQCSDNQVRINCNSSFCCLDKSKLASICNLL